MYPTGSSSNIGTLLRMIQEDQNKSLPAQNPSLDPNSPMRGVIQGPINAPESPGSSRQISVRPEGAIQQGPQASVVGPVAPPVVSAPVAPVQGPTNPVARSSGVSAPSTPSLSSISPALGTRISSAPRGIAASTSFSSSARPAGQAVASKPSVSKNQPTTSKVSGSQGAFGGGVKTAAAEAFLPRLAQALAGSTLAKIFTPLSFVNPQLISPKGSFSKSSGKVY